MSHRRSGNSCSLAPHFTVRRSAHVCARGASQLRGKNTIDSITTYHASVCNSTITIYAGTAESDKEPYTTGIVSEPSMVEPPLTQISTNQPPIDHQIHDAYSNSPSHDGAPTGQMTTGHPKTFRKGKAYVRGSVNRILPLPYIYLYIPFPCGMM